MDDRKTHREKRQSLLAAAFFGSCPKCGARTLFSGPVNFSDKCSNCDLDYSAFNVGDGPAAFITLIVGTLIIVMALTIELSWHPPFWLHIILWVPLTVIMTMLSLRSAKGILLILEYRNQAGEGVIDDS